jgi:hypothetical protein
VVPDVVLRPQVGCRDPPPPRPPPPPCGAVEEALDAHALRQIEATIRARQLAAINLKESGDRCTVNQTYDVSNESTSRSRQKSVLTLFEKKRECIDVPVRVQIRSHEAHIT